MKNKMLRKAAEAKSALIYRDRGSDPVRCDHRFCCWCSGEE